MTHNDYEEEERRNDWNVPSTTSRKWRAEKISNVTPLNFQPMRGSKSFYLDIMGKGEINPYGGRYIIKYLKTPTSVHDYFAVYGAFSRTLIPNSVIRFNRGIASYESPEASEGSPNFDVDRLYEGTWISLLRNGNPVVSGDQPSSTGEPSTYGGRRRRRKTKRARRGRRRSSRKA